MNKLSLKVVKLLRRKKLKISFAGLVLVDYLQVQ